MWTNITYMCLYIVCVCVCIKHANNIPYIHILYIYIHHWVPYSIQTYATFVSTILSVIYNRHAGIKFDAGSVWLHSDVTTVTQITSWFAIAVTLNKLKPHRVWWWSNPNPRHSSPMHAWKLSSVRVNSRMLFAVITGIHNIFYVTQIVTEKVSYNKNYPKRW